jgi:hypothetical protein
MLYKQAIAHKVFQLHHCGLHRHRWGSTRALLLLLRDFSRCVQRQLYKSVTSTTKQLPAADAGLFPLLTFLAAGGATTRCEHG